MKRHRRDWLNCHLRGRIVSQFSTDYTVSFGMWHCVICYKFNILEKCIASILGFSKQSELYAGCLPDIWVYLFIFFATGGSKMMYKLIRQSLLDLLYLLYQTQITGKYGAWSDMRTDGKLKHFEKTRPNATLSDTDPTWPELGSTSDHCSSACLAYCLTLMMGEYILKTLNSMITV
jgi:hypothetical protein